MEVGTRIRAATPTEKLYRRCNADKEKKSCFFRALSSKSEFEDSGLIDRD